MKLLQHTPKNTPGYLALLFLFFCSSIILAKSQIPDSLRERIHTILERNTDSITTRGRLIFPEDDLNLPGPVYDYYSKTNCSPVWVNGTGMRPLADTLLTILKQCYTDGLNPEYYHFSGIESLVHDSLTGSSLQPWLRIELLLTDALLTYASDIYAGHVHSDNENVDWDKHMSGINLTDSLKTMVKNNTLREALSHFSNKLPPYIALKNLLAKYNAISKNGGWDTIPVHTHIKQGDKSTLVIQLKKRLAINDGTKPYPFSLLFDSALEAQVKKTRVNYGLDSSGGVSSSLLTALNVSAENRIEQVKQNMERWRWLPHNMEQPYIVVNIAGFMLYVIDSNKRIMDMKIIVGKTYTQTPLFNARMKYIVIGPWWEVPATIAKKEILPELKKHKDYLEKNHMRVYDGWKKDAREISADSINWDTVYARNFTYRLRQEPGPWNALGTIKFMFPNKYDVYLHDTPQPELFLKRKRAFSHGCIRIEKPLELAAYLLQDYWSKESLTAAIDTASDLTVTLDKPVNVNICYFTAWINSSGEASFRPDIYGYDKRLKELMALPVRVAKQGL